MAFYSHCLSEGNCNHISAHAQKNMQARSRNLLTKWHQNLDAWPTSWVLAPHHGGKTTGIHMEWSNYITVSKRAAECAITGERWLSQCGRRYSLSAFRSQLRDLWLREWTDVIKHSLLKHAHTRLVIPTMGVDLHKTAGGGTKYKHTHTQPFYCSSGICPGPPGWAGIRKVKLGRLKPIWIYWSKR